MVVLSEPQCRGPAGPAAQATRRDHQQQGRGPVAAQRRWRADPARPGFRQALRVLGTPRRQVGSGRLRAGGRGSHVVARRGKLRSPVDPTHPMPHIEGDLRAPEARAFRDHRQPLEPAHHRCAGGVGARCLRRQRRGRCRHRRDPRARRLELRGAARALAVAGRHAAIVALGCVVRGDTRHYEQVADGASDGLMRVALDTGVPVMNGVLAVERFEDAAHAPAAATATRARKPHWSPSKWRTCAASSRSIRDEQPPPSRWHRSRGPFAFAPARCRRSMPRQINGANERDLIAQFAQRAGARDRRPRVFRGSGARRAAPCRRTRRRAGGHLDRGVMKWMRSSAPRCASPPTS